METPLADLYLGGQLAGAIRGWMRHAACVDVDTTLFFPAADWYPGQRWRGSDVDSAVKQLCAGCPVREECLSWALDLPEEHGFWAGTTANERERLRRGVSRKGCPVCACRDLLAQHGRQVCLDCGMSWTLKRGVTDVTDVETVWGNGNPPAPVDPTVPRCGQCQTPLPVADTKRCHRRPGRAARWCSSRCRLRAYRCRVAAERHDTRKTCGGCGQPITAANSRRVWCSAYCRLRAWRCGKR